MDKNRSAAKRMMWLAVAVGTVLCVAGTVLVFVVALVGFALLFISFCVLSVVPFQAFGLLGSGSRDAAPGTATDDGGASEFGSMVRAGSRQRTFHEPSTRRRRR